MQLLRLPSVEKMHSSVAVAVPAYYALPAVETVLREFANEPGRASLALNVRQLHLPFQATIAVAVAAHVAAGEAQNEWRLHIEAVLNPAIYPTFDGVLALLPAAEAGSQLQLDGEYTVPFGRIGRALDDTLLRGAAKKSLERFLREIAYRVAALARWAAPS